MTVAMVGVLAVVLILLGWLLGIGRAAAVRGDLQAATDLAALAGAAARGDCSVALDALARSLPSAVATCVPEPGGRVLLSAVLRTTILPAWTGVATVSARAGPVT